MFHTCSRGAGGTEGGLCRSLPVPHQQQRGQLWGVGEWEPHCVYGKSYDQGRTEASLFGCLFSSPDLDCLPQT